ncbi:hypothetical protein J8L86_11430 [Shewanella sp. MMG014]|uniref:hypothetical protein n=1 Tax=Shewanella sp. MMG014 TaxID=2822691 RepID=UPI001B38D439|nr:hypothetical protein [Shewanella sp. MMG014]MBQ4890460.1 hypothetical protein [Shewanella sp. MMG014]
MNIHELPYDLPKTPKGKSHYLSKVLTIPQHLLSGKYEEESEAMAGVILYRHLTKEEKYQSMLVIHRLQNRPLKGRLIEKITDVTVNPQWGVWSLSNTELLQDQKFHDTINTYASTLGVSASALSSKDFAVTLWKTRKVSKGGWVSLVIWGSVYFNASELSKANKEISNRSRLLDSAHY